MPAGKLKHRLDGDGAQAAPLEIARDHDHERAEDVRPALVEATRDRSVDPRGQVLDAPTPAHGNRARAGQDLIVDAHKVELELGLLLGQAAPVAIEHVAVVVVLGQDIAGPLPGPLGEVGPLGDGHSLHPLLMMA